ncbi:MAG: choice-of-anchor L domain-containing protein [Nonlabens sp.]
MKVQEFSILVASFIFSISGYGQLVSTSNPTNTESIVRNALTTSCVELNNISLESDGSIDSIESFGAFQAGSSNFPFQDGFVLTSGKLSEVGNSEIQNDLSQGSTSWTGDSDLESALGISNTLNSTALIMEVTSATGILTFNYVMVSEEYQQDFPCNVSDGFALLIRPAGDLSWTNMATLPNTNIPVGIETVHPEIIGQCSAVNENFYTDSHLTATNFEGGTTVMTAAADVIPNQPYELKMVVADQHDTRYDTAVFIEAGSLQAEVNLGQNITTCTPVTLDAGLNTSASYEWYRNGNLLSGETSSTLTANQSGIYQVGVTIGSGGSVCVLSDQVEVTIEPNSLDFSLLDFQICEENMQSDDAIIVYNDLIEFVENQITFPNAESEVYGSRSDAESRINAISGDSHTSNIPSNTLTLRIENTDTNCYGITEIGIQVNSLPVVPAGPLELCDEDNDGMVTIDYAELSPLVSDEHDVIASFYPTLSYAENGINELNGEITLSQGSQLFFSLTNSMTGCISTGNIFVNINYTPEVLTDEAIIDACDPDYDGFATFDLTSVIPEIVTTTSGLNITYHLSQNEALDNINEITTPEQFDNTEALFQNVFIRIEDNMTGCPSMVNLQLYTNYLLYESQIEERYLCDDPSNDGVAYADLTGIATEIAQGLDVNIEFYESDTDRSNRNNEVDQTAGYSVNSRILIYMIIENDTCTEYAEFQIIVTPFFQGAQIEELTYCDPEADNVADIDLEDYEAEVQAVLGAGVSFSYFETFQDAQDEVNPITSLHNVMGTSVTIYANTTNQYGCYSVQTVRINLATEPQTTAPDPLEICDTDHDGEILFDLTSLNDSIITDPNAHFSYHETAIDAENNTAEIFNPTLYPLTSGILFFRVSYPSTGCYRVETLHTNIGYVPDLDNIPPLVQCEQNTDGTASFTLENHTDIISSGRTDVSVDYYMTRSNAMNQHNSIDPATAMTNGTNPQPVFVRVYDTDRPECHEISFFELIVDELPDYNPPADVEICDDNFDNQLAFSLEDIRSQIFSGHTGNSTITFHTSESDAINGTSALQGNTYVNQTNPEVLFIRIDNNTLCFQTEQVQLRVKEKPFVQQTDPLISCNVVDSERAIFDLTSSEIDIVGTRSFNNRLSWHTSPAGAETGSDEISSPNQYQSTATNDTVYLRVFNLVSGCQSIMPLELINTTPPQVLDVADHLFCETDQNTIELDQFTDDVVPDSFLVEVSFHQNEEDAASGARPIISPHRLAPGTNEIFARVVDLNTDCSNTTSFNIIVVAKPSIPSSQQLRIEECDEDYDTIRHIDLNRLDDIILNGRSDSDFEVNYYFTREDAEEDILRITREEFMDGDIAFAKIKNLETGCSSIQQIPIVINIPPEVPVAPTEFLCDGYLAIDLGIPGSNNTYLWSTGATTPHIEITQTGRYWVELTSEKGCVSPRRFFDVEASGPPTILSTTATDFSDHNTIRVVVEGLGDWIYILDKYTVQESPLFTDVSPGYHTIEVRDRNGCAPSAFEEVLVLDYPKFFTPNADSYNDTWDIKNLEVYDSSMIYIFDRYGKQLAEFIPGSGGWDGFYGNAKMPSSDYWFRLVVEDESKSFKVKGHFALKR